MKPAMFWEPVNGTKSVKCGLCGIQCTIASGKLGSCGVRKNVDGKLVSLVYGKLCSIAMDPIEKKPFFHFAPGSRTLSIATVGCNLKCSFCQNSEISQEYGEICGREMTPKSVVSAALEAGAEGISYTYTEPTVFYEFAYDTMRIARKEGLYNTWVSNGYTMPNPIRKASRYLDAINIDFKGDDSFYRNVCGVPGIEPVKKALSEWKKNKVFIEVTTLLIPGKNDSEKTIRQSVQWIKDNLGASTPLHFSRFYPQYRLSGLKPTPVETLEKAYDIAKEMGMEYVYTGNVPGHRGENTLCPNCGSAVVERSGYSITAAADTCPKCKKKVLIAGRKWACF